MGEETEFSIVAEDLGRMTAAGKKKIYVLAFLLSLLAVSIYYNNRTTNYYSPRTTLPSLISSIPVTPVSQADEIPSVALLRHRVPEFRSSRRNVFEFGATGTQAGADEDPEDSNDSTSGESDPGELQNAVPGSEITFLGVYREKDDPAATRAAISIAGRIYVGAAGETLAGRCKVLAVDGDTLTLQLLPDDIPLRYTLGRGQAPEAVPELAQQ